MFPTTNFEEIYAYLNCPAKLYLKLIGAKSEIERGYTKPKVNPYLLGLEGEKAIADGYEREITFQIPDQVELKRKKIEKEISFPELIQSLTQTIVGISEQIELKLQQLQVSISDPKLTDLAKRMKKDFGIDAILHKVPYTTTPHHLIGEIDFLGLRNEKEFIVIEAKNVKKVTKQNLAKLEYYIYGLPKGYNFTKIQEHAYELVGQLYPSKIQSYWTYVSSYNYLSNGYVDIRNEVSDVISQNSSIEKKFKEKYQAIDNFLKSIPSARAIIEKKNKARKKANIQKADFLDTINYILDILSKGAKDGIIVNIRDQSIQETTLELDFNTVVRKIWAVKKNVTKGNFVCERNLKSCKRCQYEIQCRGQIIDGVLDNTESITSIAHKGFSKLNYSCPDFKNLLLVGDNPDKWAEHAKHLLSSYSIKSSKTTNHELLEPILSTSDWGYKEGYARKPRWKSLFRDAVVSKTLEKELKFWKL